MKVIFSKMVESPAWHQQALQETERRLSSGQEKIVPWPDAKKELRKRFKANQGA